MEFLKKTVERHAFIQKYENLLNIVTEQKLGVKL
jgi:hypothetical protein